MQLITRSINTTLKQIKRSGWLALASVAVMTLAFLVTTIFVGLAFVLNLVLKSIENDPHIYVFFKAGTEEEHIIEKKESLEQLDNIESIIYTSEEEALEEFKEYNEKANPITAEAIRDDILPPSLGIRLHKIDDAEDVIKNVEIERETDDSIISVGYSETVIENIKEIVNIVRLVGLIIIGMLIIVILLFTLFTVEFRMFSRSEEIGIMQLVGGSLFYIRLPFVIESGIYGMLGALFSNLIIVGSYFGILHYYSETDLMQFINRFFGNLPWPDMTLENIFIVFSAIILVGFLIGIVNSSIAIRRYIK